MRGGSQPGQVIRALRHALDMSQAEFARAAGWAPSTISRWERGRAQPSRLAFKIILAFAEERGVRYRPKPPARALVPLYELGGEVLQPPAPLRATRALLGHRLDHDRPQAACRELVRPERRAVRATTEIPPDAARTADRFLTVAAERPRWRAEASVRISFGGAAPCRREPRLRAWPRVGLLAAGLGVVLVIGMPGARHTAPTPEPAPGRPLTLAGAWPPGIPSSRTTADAPVPPVRRPASRVVSDETGAPAPRAGPVSDAATPSEVAPALAGALAPPSPVRLEGVVVVGNTLRATVRTASGTMTVREGDTLGTRQVRVIAADRVTVVGPTGERQTLRVGTQAVLD